MPTAHYIATAAAKFVCIPKNTPVWGIFQTSGGNGDLGRHVVNGIPHQHDVFALKLTGQASAALG
jgi:hypothetical protein